MATRTKTKPEEFRLEPDFLDLMVEEGHAPFAQGDNVAEETVGYHWTLEDGPGENEHTLGCAEKAGG